MIRSALVIACLGVLAAPAIAQDKAPNKAAVRKEAKKFFRAGQQAFDAGQYVMASDAFEQAYNRLPLPAIAFSTAQAHRLQYFIDKDASRLKRAIELYRIYLTMVASGERRDDAGSNLAELEPILLRLEAGAAGPIAAMGSTGTDDAAHDLHQHQRRPGVGG